jgi:hypothetical protein
MLMKIYLLVIISYVVALSTKAQNFNISDSVVSSNTVINLPLQPHQRNVDIFFNGDKPKQPYYNIRVIDVSGSNVYQDLLNAIQEKAKNEGLDGLIILGKENYNTYYGHISYSVNKLSAIGIKYKNNMQYVNHIVKRAIILHNDSLEVDTINFNLNSKIIANNNPSSVSLYENSIKLFYLCDYYATHKMLSNAVKNNDETAFSTTIKTDSQFGNAKYKILYTSDSVLFKVQIKTHPSDEQTDGKIYDVVYDLNKDNSINKRYVRQGRKAEPVFIDSYQYDADKHFIGFFRYDEKAKRISLQVNYTYFTMNDLPQIN